MAANSPGPVVLFGSGETAPRARRVYEHVFAGLPKPVKVAVLETPAGFEPNSPMVAGRVLDFIKQRVQAFPLDLTLVPARKRGTANSPDNPAIVAPVADADAIFLGPGSPTYAVRQLCDSVAWRTIVARHQQGAALILASAATVAAGCYALPVYEIYKVGEDVHWTHGLDLFSAYGLSLVFVPHWNNNDGGTALDTSHCYMGQDRYDALVALLPPGQRIVGIDEQTALIIDLAAETCRVMGPGGVTIVGDGGVKQHAAGQSFDVRELGAFHLPTEPRQVPADVLNALEAMRAVAAAEAVVATTPPPEVLALVSEREASRTRREWAAADALRAQVADLGWRVVDTPAGPVVEPLEK
ncbi:MAG: cysteinyl-tRNA synthetase [Anaerolineae bacterium]